MAIQMQTKVGLAAAALLSIGSATAQNIIVQETFGGAGGALNGSSAETFDAGITSAGGSNSWVSANTFFDDGGVAPGTDSTNSSAHLNLGSYINDAKGASDGIFELTMTIGIVTGEGNTWFSMGFSELSSPSTTNHFLNLDATGTIILRGSGDLDMWAGSGNANRTLGPNANEGARTVTATVDLSTHNGADNFGSVTWSDSLLGELASHDYAEDVDFSSIFLSEANGTTSTLSNLTLTQVGGSDSPAVTITEIEYVPGADTVTLTWTSTLEGSYTAKYSSDMSNWEFDMGDGLSMADDENENDGDQLTKTFNLAEFFIENMSDLFFRIEQD